MSSKIMISDPEENLDGKLMFVKGIIESTIINFRKTYIESYMGMKGIPYEYILSEYYPDGLTGKDYNERVRALEILKVYGLIKSYKEEDLYNDNGRWLVAMCIIDEDKLMSLSKDLEKSKIGFQSNIKFLLSKDDDYTILNINSRSAYRVKNNTKYHKFFKILEREKEISTSKLYISIYSGERDKVDRDMKDKLRGLLKQTKMKPLRNRSHNLSFDYSKDNLVCVSAKKVTSKK